MKKLSLKIGLVGLILAVATTSYARTTAATTSSGGGNTRVGLGFSTFGGSYLVTGTLTTPALSGWIDIGSLMSLQILAAINGSDPFEFGAGGVFRYTLSGDNSHGFHAGVGINMGTVGAGSGLVATGAGTTQFFLNIFPLIGFHFDVLTNIRLAFDGGAVLAVTPSPFQFKLQTNSLLGGASIHYFF